MVDEGREPFFLWLHYSDPHAPYILPEGVENPFVGDPWYVGDELAKLEISVTATSIAVNTARSRAMMT